MAGAVFAEGNDDQRCEQARDTGRCDQQRASSDKRDIHEEFKEGLHKTIMKQREGFVNG